LKHDVSFELPLESCKMFLNGLAGCSGEFSGAISGLSLSIVLPCYNEERNIERTVRQVQQWFSEDGINGQIIVTDDGSTDATPQILAKLCGEISNLIVVRHPHNQGYGAAVRSGCDHAERQWIGFMDSDGQFHAEDFRHLIPLTRQTDFATGYREKRADSLQRRLNSWMYNTMIRVCLGVHPRDINCGMKIFRRSLWPTIRPIYATGALINGEMFYALKHANIAFSESPVPHYPRVAGTPTGANVGVILRMFKEFWELKRSRKAAAAAATVAAEAPELLATDAAD
jgi:glycosyltransferase involved in cell wall biosynthesis